MPIHLNNISKRFGTEWILKNVDLKLEENQQYAVVGPNGSGKSTLLKIIANGIVPTHGKVEYSLHQKNVDSEFDINKNIAFTAPYISILEDFSLKEIYEFHSKLVPMYCSNLQEFLDITTLEKHQDKYIKYFSSGMKQRVKIALAILSKTAILILDEPSTNFDDKATQWYINLVQKYMTDRIVLIGSNQAHEYQFCQQTIDILNYK